MRETKTHYTTTHHETNPLSRERGNNPNNTHERGRKTANYAAHRSGDRNLSTLRLAIGHRQGVCLVARNLVQTFNEPGQQFAQAIHRKRLRVSNKVAWPTNVGYAALLDTLHGRAVKLRADKRGAVIALCEWYALHAVDSNYELYCDDNEMRVGAKASMVEWLYDIWSRSRRQAANPYAILEASQETSA